ncbi:MAG: prenyltransferase [Wenzhouxiangella sp.]
MSRVQLMVGVARGPFLVLGVLCVAVAAAAVVAEQGRVDAWLLLLVLLAASLAHASVNAFNEYRDFRSGLDLMTLRTPMSGGSGTLPAHPAAARLALLFAVACLIGSVVIGVYLASRSDWRLLIPGFVGVALVCAYTPWINRSAWLCLLAPGLGFGPVITLGAYWVLGGQQTDTAVLLSLLVGLLASSLLLLNQFPDVEADRRVGRAHFPIRYGLEASVRVFAGLQLSVLLLLLTALLTARLPAAVWPVVLLPLLALPGLLRRAFRAARDAASQLPAMIANLVYTLSMLLALALSLFVASLMA